MKVLLAAALLAGASGARALTGDDKLAIEYTDGGTARRSSGATARDESGILALVGSPPLALGSGLLLIPIGSYSSTGGAIANDGFTLREADWGAVTNWRLAKKIEATAVQTATWRVSNASSLSDASKARYEGTYLLAYLPRGDERFSLSFGGSFSHAFGRPQLFPAAGLLYESLDKSVLVEAGFPTSDVLFRRGPWEYGAFAQVTLGAYEISPVPDPASGRTGDRLRLTRFDLGPQISRLLPGGLVLTAKGGLRVLDRSELLALDGREVAATDETTRPVWMCGVSLSLRP